MKNNKPFYKMNHVTRQGDVIEYSTDFDFFMANQVRQINSDFDNTRQVCSCIEAKCFETRKIINAIAIHQPDFEMEDYKRIHKEILEGKFGAGKFVD